METKEHSIRFTAEEVRATRAGLKTQTRQIAEVLFDEYLGGWATKIDRHGSGWVATFPYKNPHTGEHAERFAITSPWNIGDRLWVKECWQIGHDAGGRPRRFTLIPDTGETDRDGIVFYRADGHPEVPGWRSSVHMPRWASRILLEITGIRLERDRNEWVWLVEFRKVEA